MADTENVIKAGILVKKVSAKCYCLHRSMFIIVVTDRLSKITVSVML
jgi:hypothetical protein